MSETNKEELRNEFLDQHCYHGEEFLVESLPEQVFDWFYQKLEAKEKEKDIEHQIYADSAREIVKNREKLIAELEEKLRAADQIVRLLLISN